MWPNEPTHEEAAFRGAWNYLKERVHDSTIYYFCKYERTEFKKLAEKYPAVCSVEEVEAMLVLTFRNTTLAPICSRFGTGTGKLATREGNRPGCPANIAAVKYSESGGDAVGLTASLHLNVAALRPPQ